MTPHEELGLLAFAVQHPYHTRTVVGPLPSKVKSDNAKVVAKAIFETYCVQASDIWQLKDALSARNAEIDALRTELQLVTDRLLAIENGK